ncbi:MAG: polyprenyl synthetase family protein [Luteolibacter sp.]
MTLKEYLKDTAGEVDICLREYLPKPTEKPATIHQAMRYSVFAGGKRLRPILCIAAAEACGGTRLAALPAACAVELLHTYSLVHDDLPCMDNDDLRRGKPTCHKVYGDGMAVLCGDALLTEAFLVLARTPDTSRYQSRDYLLELSNAASSRQLIGGQVMDLEAEGKKLTKNQLSLIHQTKTAALLAASIRLGAMTANATPPQLRALTAFGQALGLAFQIIDDILDVTQTTEVLGKTAGKDEAVEKSTYPSVIGLEASRTEATRLTREALDSLNPLKKNAARLREITEYLLLRDF